MSQPPQGVPTAGAPEEPHTSNRSPTTGLDSWERVASAAAGGALVVRGLRRRSAGGAAMALAGGWLLARGVSGRGRPVRAFGKGTGGETDREGHGPPADAPEVERSVTVGRPADELSEVWHDPERLSHIAGHFAEVTGAGVERLHWTVPGPLGRTLSWETRVVEERPGELLRWESLDGASVPNEGEIRFEPAPGDRGTEVTLRVRFDPPGGGFGDAAMRLLGVVPDTLVGKTLRRFKSLAETGEVPTLAGNPSARGSGDLV
ncbi:SRPBCC family protein [Halorarum halophilum]|uniref:SRPBCC family protein n=1 Tax=Halorarum halophilum TaxID=2743090 RepID=A0A7D5K8S5_9EURY|nr:SRPBCC family protein [Halobaculum halophilum]QLG28434.1 SRPBCC family protein [Halobaculum halophilum]